MGEHFEVFRNKTRLKEEVLRRITSDGKFGSNHDFRAFAGELLVGGRNFLKIAAQITHGDIDLGKADLHARQRRLCAWRQAAKDFAYLWGASGSLARCS